MKFKRITKFSMSFVSFVITALIITTGFIGIIILPEKVSAAGPTEVSGLISQNTVWTAANSPYHVIDNLTLYQGKTLTIQAGVVVKFRNNTEMKIKGRLKVSGTNNNRVLFTNLSPNYKTSAYHTYPTHRWFNSTGVRYWIYVDGPNGGSIDISYAKFEYARNYALYIAQPDTDDGKQDKLTDTIFENNSGGLNGYSGPRPKVSVRRCSFINNFYGVGASDYTFYDCIFKNNFWGIHYSYSVRNCVFQNNSIGTSQVNRVYDCIVQNSTRGIYSGSKVFNCSLFDNEFGLYYASVAYNCTIYNNKVGAKSSTVKFSKIFQNELGLNSSNSIRNSIFNNINGLHQLDDSRDNVNVSNIYNNTNYNFIMGSKNDHNCSNNWWGTTVTSVIDQKIYDIWDNPTVGEAFYQPILTSPIDITFKPPVADAGRDQRVLVGEEVFFNASNSYDPEGDSLRYVWNFGDSSYSEYFDNPTCYHYYNKAGLYTVTLTVQYDSLYEDTDTCIINVTQRPVADAGLDQSVKVNQTVIFNGSGSFDPDNDPLKYNWSFGDDNYTGWQQSFFASHKYTIPGEFYVTLNVTDDIGWDLDQCIIKVSEEEVDSNESKNETDDNKTKPSGGSDTDNDGLKDDWEVIFVCDPMDPDSDDDGVLDGDEELIVDSPSDIKNDPDGDGWNNAKDADSDGDGILDGTEKGITDNDLNLSATDISKGHFSADQDPETTTDMTDWDTDNDTWSDGDEDKNANGKYEPERGELDPLFKDYDNDNIHDDEDDDDDNDGMSDEFENEFELNQLDPDDRDEDKDGDGYSNFREYLGVDNLPGNSDWTNPTNPNSHPGKKIDSDGDKIPDFNDRFPNDSAEWNDSDDDGVGDNSDPFPMDSTQWKDTDGDGYGDNLAGNFPDLFPNDPAEWADMDRDGVGDNKDPNPNDPEVPGLIRDFEDSDSDEIPNYWEIEYNLNPWDSSDALKDLDNDTLTNLQEFKLGTDPTKSDTDGDGYSDNVDDYPTDPTQFKRKSTFDEQFNNYYIAALIVIVVMFLLIILKLTIIIKKRKVDTEETQVSEKEYINKLMYDILYSTDTDELETSNSKLQAILERKYSRGELSEETYDYIMNNVIIPEEQQSFEKT